MSIDDVIRIHMQKLAERESWRTNELPEELTVDILRIMDGRGLIQFRTWERGEPNPQPHVNPDPTKMVLRPQKYSDWFSPSLQPRYGGDLDNVLAKGENDPELAPGIRVSEHGRAKLAELELEARIGKPPPPTLDEDYEGFVSADALWVDHGIHKSRLSRAATAGTLETKPALKGLKDSQGHEIRKLYNKKQAIKHCSVKRKARK